MKTVRTLPLSLVPAVFLAAVATGVLLTPATAAEPTAPAAPAIAQAGGVTLKTADVQALLDGLPAAERDAVAKNPALLTQAVRTLLTRRLAAKEASDKKFDQTPEVKAKLEAAREAALVELYLQSVAKLPDNFPSEAEIEAAYEANKTAFVAPRQYRLAQIYIAAPRGDKADQAQAKLAEAERALKAKGADFGRIAAQFSDAKAEAEKGGEIGWFAETQIVPGIRDLAAGLVKGGVSEPVRLDDGFHIVKLLDTKPAGTLPLAEVKPALIQRLREAKGQQLRQAWLGQLLQKDPPVVNEMALTALMQRKLGQ